MPETLELFTSYDPREYPRHCAGAKRVGPSEEAAKKVTPSIEEAHALMLAKYRELGPMTADEAWQACGWTQGYGRPRNSELVKMGELINTGRRGKSIYGSSATIWDVKR
jgi:hypothetical protein